MRALASRTRPWRRLIRSCVLLGAAGLPGCSGGEALTGALEPPPRGTLAVAVSGVPEGAAVLVGVTGPGAFSRTLSASDTLRDLVPGNYVITSGNIAHQGHTWSPTAAEQSVAVAAPGPVATASVAFEIATGAVAVTVTGLPAGTEAGLTLTGPGAQVRPVQGTTTFTGLQPGAWSLTGSPVTAGTATWVPSLPAAITVTAGVAPTAVTVTFSRLVGSLDVGVTGLPAGVGAVLRVTGPGGFAAVLSGATVLGDLDPGSYQVVADSVRHAGHIWAPSPLSQSAMVAASNPVTATVHYAITTGGLTVAAGGLPTGAAAPVTVSGPAGFSATATGTQAWVGLAPGTYLVAAGSVVVSGQTWLPSPASQAVQVTAGTTPSLATITYAPVTGSLAVSVSGLPGSIPAAVTVTGPGGYSQPLGASTTLTGLSPGAYSVIAAAVTAGTDTWDPTPASQGAGVVAGATAAATVAYVFRPPPPPPPPPPPSLNLRIDGVYLTQAAQRYDGSVPLVAGRDAYLRAFAVANQGNTAAPSVRVRLYHGAALMQTVTIPATAPAVPLTAEESNLAGSWNVLVPGSLVQPGLRVAADVDPAGAIAEASETDNAFPAGGTVTVDVRALPSFAVRFVPVLQQANGLQGNVSEANKAQYLAQVRAMLPIGAYDAEVRAPYTTTAPALQSDNANGAWGTILSELLALRTADASARYYYGVVRTTYSSGVAGIGYVGGGARTALGWDRLPSGSGVMAHELGHNMGRSHAPCGGVSGPDPSFPHAGGGIGVWGMEVATLSLKSPATYKDLMGYCNPEWVSDYNWAAMVAYRQGGPNNTDGQTGGRADGRGLLVWGRLTASGPVLEPAFVVDAPASVPAPGPHRLELVGLAGEVLGSMPFRAVEVHDLPGGREESFAFVIPFDRAVAVELTALRIASGGIVVERQVERRAPAASVAPDPRGGTVVRWSASETPMLLIRDGATGGILSFARGGELRVPIPASRVQVLRPAMK